MINNAINFVMENSINPNLNNLNVINNQSLRNKINHAKIFIQNAKKVGDLYSYLIRSIANTENHDEMMEFNLIAFEDIIQEFEERFQYYLNDTLKFEDFVVGQKYTSYDICYLSKHHNVQSGIYRVQNNDETLAVCIKVRLDGEGTYNNEWINGRENQDLKYYMQSRNKWYI